MDKCGYIPEVACCLLSVMVLVDLVCKSPLLVAKCWWLLSPLRHMGGTWTPWNCGALRLPDHESHPEVTCSIFRPEHLTVWGRHPSFRKGTNNIRHDLLAGKVGAFCYPEMEIQSREQQTRPRVSQWVLPIGKCRWEKLQSHGKRKDWGEMCCMVWKDNVMVM